MNKEREELLAKIKSLQEQVKQVKDEDKGVIWDLSKFIFGIVILICLYPFFRFGWFLLTINF